VFKGASAHAMLVAPKQREGRGMKKLVTAAIIMLAASQVLLKCAEGR
jgi:hypothetical protein